MKKATSRLVAVPSNCSLYVLFADNAVSFAAALSHLSPHFEKIDAAQCCIAAAGDAALMG
ncbi:MAG: hypothetical protein IT562_25705 [Alphaproteobacteria bacterium]|nr:hypothetical protein [Alphaproteobacteria bacterium]